LDVYKVQGTTKEKFVANVMQHCHLYITHHATKTINATTSYKTKHETVNNDMV
jgi:hypothetical protein